ncbi:MAG: hypothetical protein U0N90_14835 [Blautia sp.]
MKKRFKIFHYLLLFSLPIISFTVSCKNSNDSKTETITICTEERIKYIVEDMIKYYNNKRETPVDFQVTYIPEDENERAGVCKRLRTELMTGKGMDIYILSEYQRNGGLVSVDEETLLLPDANKTLDSGVFMDVSEYIAGDESFKKCFAPVMKAGEIEGKQYILPISFDTNMLKSEKNGNGSSIDMEDCKQPLPELLKEGKLKNIHPDSFMLDVRSWIGNSFDYRKGQIYFSKEDITYVLGYAAANYDLYESNFVPEYIVASGQYESLHSFEAYLDELQATEYEYLPMVTLDGRPAARILSYGAVGRSCKNPELAYDFLRIFWQAEFVSRDGLPLPHEDFTAYYQNATVLNLLGIPVREDLWEKWYLIKSGTSEPTETAIKNAQNFSNALRQTATVRFLCTIDNLGTEISNMFMKDGYVSLDKEGIDEDIELAAGMLYNNIRYIVME